MWYKLEIIKRKNVKVKAKNLERAWAYTKEKYPEWEVNSCEEFKPRGKRRRN